MVRFANVSWEGYIDCQLDWQRIDELKHAWLVVLVNFDHAILGHCENRDPDIIHVKLESLPYK